MSLNAPAGTAAPPATPRYAPLAPNRKRVRGATGSVATGSGVGTKAAGRATRAGTVSRGGATSPGDTVTVVSGGAVRSLVTGMPSFAGAGRSLVTGSRVVSVCATPVEA